MSNHFSKLLVFLVLGSSINVHAMWDVQEAVKRGTLEALEIERRIVEEQRAREEERRYQAEHPQEVWRAEQRRQQEQREWFFKSLDEERKLKQQRLESQSCQDCAVDCSCCWDEESCGCNFWQCIAALLCFPTLGFCGTTTEKDCLDCIFCNSSCCCFESCH